MSVRYQYGHITWERMSDPPRLFVGGGKNAHEDAMMIDGEARDVIQVDTFRLPEDMSDQELREWMENNPERVQRRLQIVKEEVKADYLDYEDDELWN